jgi:sulfur-oxidizing protein SoxZ
MARTLINVPAKAKRGQVIEIKTLISHVMETGYRRNEVGAMVPRDIINTFVCTYNGEEVLRTDLHPAIAANPSFSFFATATESGKFEFKWTDDEGNVETASADITVE